MVKLLFKDFNFDFYLLYYCAKSAQWYAKIFLKLTILVSSLKDKLSLHYEY